MWVFCATANGFICHCMACMITARQSAGLPWKCLGRVAFPSAIILAMVIMASILGTSSTSELVCVLIATWVFSFIFISCDCYLATTILDRTLHVCNIFLVFIFAWMQRVVDAVYCLYTMP